MKTIIKAAVSPLIVIAYCFGAHAQTSVGTFVAIKGDVKVLKTPTVQSKGPFVKYGGQKWLFDPARIGKKVRPGEVVQTGTDGKAKVIFANGDHFLIDIGSSIVMPKVEGDGKRDVPVLNIFYGKLRSLISKTGPHNNLQVKTPSAVAGVRGTDFYINHAVGETKLTVLRGKVEVKAQATEPIEVTSGNMIQINVQKTKNNKKKIKLQRQQAPKEELLEIQLASRIVSDPAEMESVETKVKQKIQSLESKAQEAVIEDIRIEQPELAQEIEAQKVKGIDEINSMVVAKTYKSAPRKEKKKKLSEDELNQIDKEVYDKYFKPARGK